MRRIRLSKKLSGKKGQALILSYMVIAVFIIISGGLLTKAISENNISERNRLTTETFYMAEGATDNAIAAFTSAIANFQVPVDVATFNLTTTFTTFGNATVNTTITRLDEVDRISIEGNTNVYVANYEVDSTAVHPQNDSIVVRVHQIVARRLIPTFQHAVFYDKDLEILPGANMTISGRIHSNQDIYLGTDSVLTVTSTSLHSAGGIFNKRKDSDYQFSGNVAIQIDKPGSPTYANMAGLDSTSPTWVADSTSRWQGTVESAAHGVTKLSTPSVGTTQPDGYYANQANVVITNNSVVKNGVTLVEGQDYPVGTITSSLTSFYNNRDGEYIKMTTVDLSKLSGKTGTCNEMTCPNNLPSDGLLYVTRNDAGSSEPGIKLVNGGEIVNTNGLTVVSNQPVYIQGDYNTVNEKPTAVIADAVNLLSNNWNDANSTQSVTSRPANATTFNSAFVAGIDTTTPGGYNGGLENYPRLHENWTSQQLTIKGSFVSLWNSSVATGNWAYGNPQYTAPVRNWSYNINFNDPSKLPPFTPWAVEAQRVAWWTD